MEILLIRHGLPERVESDQPVDPLLCATGHLQAEALATWLRDDPPQQVISSTMNRARETAMHIANAFGLTLNEDEDFCEFDRGANAYIPIEELDRNHPHFVKLIEDWFGPSGASLRNAFQSRVVGALHRHCESIQTERLAIVCHGGVINALLASILETDRMMFFEPAYTSISRISWNTKRFRLHSINEAAHLRSVPNE